MDSSTRSISRLRWLVGHDLSRTCCTVGWVLPGAKTVMGRSVVSPPVRQIRLVNWSNCDGTSVVFDPERFQCSRASILWNRPLITSAPEQPKVAKVTARWRSSSAICKATGILRPVAVRTEPFGRSRPEGIKEFLRVVVVDPADFLVPHDSLGQHIGPIASPPLALRQRVGSLTDGLVVHAAGIAEPDRLVWISLARCKRIAQRHHKHILDNDVLRKPAPVRQSHLDFEA